MKFLYETLGWDDFSWQGTVDGPVLPKIRSNLIELRVDTEDEQEIPPHDLQVDAWKSLVEDGANYCNLILLGFYDYYLIMRPKYLLAGDDWARNMPEISSADDIAQMLTLNSVGIGWPYDGVAKVGFAFDCKWDREHGAGIAFRNGKQFDIGGVDCLY